MAFAATLHIEGHPDYIKGLQVDYFTFAYSQGFSQTGQPTGKVVGGVINVSIKNLNDRDLFRWMFSPTDLKKGEIRISSGTVNSQSFQVVGFIDAALVNYSQTFSAQAEVMANLTISCKEMDISGAKFQNLWSMSQRFAE